MNKNIEYLLSPQTIRKKSQEIFDLTKQGKTNFSINENKLPNVVDFVLQSIRSNYPNLNIPFHSRWRHFSVGGVDRVGILEKAIANLSKEEKIASKIDLVILSVFLDAGAGAQWKFRENDGALEISRSEGLAVASFYFFLSGLCSDDPKNPFQVNSKALQTIAKEDLERAFQVDEKNPLQGMDGRLLLLKNIGVALEKKKDFFGDKLPRIGGLLSYFQSIAENNRIQAKDILHTIQVAFSDIWPNRLTLDGFNLGDVWQYPALGDGIQSYIPFHKLSQWLAYSLIEPLEEAGFIIENLGALTGLAEYRNGGLLVDSNLLQLKDKSLLEKKHATSSPLIIEWRALTIYYLDKIAELVRGKLLKNESEFPLVKILEGGTWWAGRKLASERSENAEPPIRIISDGTVF